MASACGPAARGAPDERPAELVLVSPASPTTMSRAHGSPSRTRCSGASRDLALAAALDDRRGIVDLADVARALLSAHGVPEPVEGAKADPLGQARAAPPHRRRDGVAPSGPSEAWNCKPITRSRHRFGFRNASSDFVARALASVKYSIGARRAAHDARNVCLRTLRGVADRRRSRTIRHAVAFDALERGHASGASAI